MSVLKPKAEKSRKLLSLRIDADLHVQIEQVREDAHAAGHVFDVSDVCARALSVAVKAARAELAALGAQPHGAGDISRDIHADDTADVRRDGGA